MAKRFTVGAVAEPVGNCATGVGQGDRAAPRIKMVLAVDAIQKNTLGALRYPGRSQLQSGFLVWIRTSLTSALVVREGASNQDSYSFSVTISFPLLDWFDDSLRHP